MSNSEVFILPVLNDNYIFIIKCNKTGRTACIDPATSKDVIDFCEKNHLKIDYILNTHHHADHVGGNKKLKEHFNLEIYGNKEDAARISAIDHRISENDVVKIGALEFKVILVYGHTIGHIAYYCENEKILFIGDTLFSSGCGRVFEGTHKQMYQSLEKITKLPLDTKIYCAHEYTLDNIEFALSIEPDNQDLIKKQQLCKKLRAQNLPTIPTNLKLELATNPFLRTVNRTLRQNIGKNSDSYNEQIFQKLRELKDIF